MVMPNFRVKSKMAADDVNANSKIKKATCVSPKLSQRFAHGLIFAVPTFEARFHKQSQIEPGFLKFSKEMQKIDSVF